MLTSNPRRQLWIMLSVIALLFALNTLALAQESTEEPAPTATLEPTATPTLTPVPPSETPLPSSTPLPTATETVEVTEEATVEVTEEPTVTEEATSEVTPEVTVEGTEEATLEPTVEPTAEPTVELPIPQVVSALAAPALRAPLNGAYVNQVRPKLTWFGVKGSRGYRLDLADNPAFTDPLLEDYATARVALTLTNKVLVQELRPGTYYWRIQVVDNLGDWSEESTVFSFTVGLEKTPKNNLFTTNIRTALAWNRSLDALRYRLLVSDTIDFSNTPVVDFTTDHNRTLRYAPTRDNPLPIANLWWRVDVEYPEGWVTSSSAFALTVTPKPLAAPTMLTPVNRSFTNNTQPEFSWTAVADPTPNPVSYWLQVSTRSNFRDIVFETQQAETTFSGLELLLDGRYYVRVATLNYLGAPSRWSRVISFTLDTIDPDVPELRLPRDASATSKASYAFTWRSVRGAVRYELRLGTSNPPEDGTVYDAGRRTSFKLNTPLVTTTYYWQVRAFDAAENVSEWSAPFSFSVQSPSNAVPVLNRFATLTPTLSWTPISWSQGYEIQIATDTRFRNSAYSIDTLPNRALNHTLATPLVEGVYYWRVRARSDVDTWGTWSTTGTFLVQTSE